MTLYRNAADEAGHRVTVSADDGVPLAVREFGERTAALTVVFVHGHCLRADSWAYLRDHLGRDWGSDVRMVFYDHRGHGESGEAPTETYTIDQLARDLDAVLRVMVPTGPIVLVGHSMGAMAAMVYARQNPETVGSRIVGIGLLASAARGLTEGGMGRCLRRPAVSMLQAAVRRAPGAMHAGKRWSRSVCEPIVRNAGFGRRKVSPRMVAFAAAMLNDTSIVTMSSFLDEFIAFDESETLAMFAAIPALVLGGSDDLMTPFARSVEMAERLPGAELVCLAGAGHGVILDRAAEVALSLTALIDRARAGLVSNGLAAVS
ncbi:alpha/beta fold hydrolase [Antrihabitans cavernicola]|uniref:Alpha/beta hydrolase n=1 Tax=Antrihabitans cavernicola TaxID=2495913 RepID=A0A5A7SBX0_9NOCA|nr:alpha/beta hydrolase [Spelaeibacter cavernicola]KAA0021731.1 alpha/beta hydrolase [Spelaeibacter cavernicola]